MALDDAALKMRAAQLEKSFWSVIKNMTLLDIPYEDEKQIREFFESAVVNIFRTLRDEAQAGQREKDAGIAEACPDRHCEGTAHFVHCGKSIAIRQQDGK